MIGGYVGAKIVKRVSRGLPIVQVYTLAQLALLAGRHASKLTPAERRRLTTLVRRGRGRPSSLNDTDADELRRLVAKLEPRLFAGTAASRLSPVPLPQRALYGGRSNPARRAVRQGQADGHARTRTGDLSRVKRAL